MDVKKAKSSEDVLVRKLVRHRLLNEIVEAIIAKQDLESIFSVVVSSLEEHLPADIASIWLCDPPCEFVTVVANGASSERIAGEMKLEKGAMVPLEAGFLQKMVGEKGYSEEQCTEKVTRLVGRFSKSGLPFLHLEPLLEEDQIEGFLVCGRKEGKEFSPEDKEFFKVLRGHLGLAFRQERLMRNLESASFELEKNQVEIAQHQQLRALGEMASGIVHDINNALSPILGYSSMILESDLATHPKTRGYLQGIRTAAENISGVINTLKELCNELREHPANRIATQTMDLTTPRWKHIKQRQGLVISKN